MRVNIKMANAAAMPHHAIMLSFPLMAASRDFILPPPEDALVPGAGEEVPAVPANP